MFISIGRIYYFTVLLITSFVLVILLNYLPGEKPNRVFANSLPSNPLVQQGIDLYQSGRFSESVSVLQQALAEIKEPKDRAVVFNNMAQAYRQLGKLDLAIAQWEQAIQIYKSQNDDLSLKLLSQVLTQQAQAYSNLGQYQQAITLLQSALKIIHNHPDLIAEVMDRGALGNAYRGLGDYERSIIAHQDSLKIAQSLKNSDYVIKAWNDLGNVYVNRASRYQDEAQSALSENEKSQATKLKQLAAQDTDAALNAYDRSLQESEKSSPIAEVKALLNLNRLLEKSSDKTSDRIDSNRNRARTLLAAMPDSQDKAFALINLAESLEQPRNPVSLRNRVSSVPNAVGLLENALTVAQNIGDIRAQSFALGTLGSFYESAKVYDKAIKLTRQAEEAAQEINATDSLYLWQWQVGRILKATGEEQRAIDSYLGAIASLQKIRSDILAANKELQLNFRDSVEPVYRQTIELLLYSSNSSYSQSQAGKLGVTPTKNIRKALETLELLALSELENYFNDGCVQVATNKAKNNADQANPTAAIVYSVTRKSLRNQRQCIQ